MCPASPIHPLRFAESRAAIKAMRQSLKCTISFSEIDSCPCWEMACYYVVPSSLAGTCTVLGTMTRHRMCSPNSRPSGHSLVIFTRKPPLSVPPSMPSEAFLFPSFPPSLSLSRQHGMGAVQEHHHSPKNDDRLWPPFKIHGPTSSAKFDPSSSLSPLGDSFVPFKKPPITAIVSAR